MNHAAFQEIMIIAISRALLLLGTYKSKHQLNIFFSPHGRSANLSVAQVKNTSQARKVCVCVCVTGRKSIWMHVDSVVLNQIICYN